MKSTLTHHTFTAEAISDENGPAILIKQPSGAGETAIISLHPWQIRAICEHFGLLATDESAAKRIRTLQRRLLALNERIKELGHYMATYSDHKHADLTAEMERLNALADLSGEWAAEIGDNGLEHGANEQPAPNLEGQQAAQGTLI